MAKKYYGPEYEARVEADRKRMAAKKEAKKVARKSKKVRRERKSRVGKTVRAQERAKAKRTKAKSPPLYKAPKYQGAPEAPKTQKQIASSRAGTKGVTTKEKKAPVKKVKPKVKPKIKPKAPKTQYEQMLERKGLKPPSHATASARLAKTKGEYQEMATNIMKEEETPFQEGGVVAPLPMANAQDRKQISPIGEEVGTGVYKEGGKVREGKKNK